MSLFAIIELQGLKQRSRSHASIHDAPSLRVRNSALLRIMNSNSRKIQ